VRLSGTGTRRQAFAIADWLIVHYPAVAPVVARRNWSAADPSLHQAVYQFADKASLDRAVNGDELKRLTADFNRDWPDVTRTREILVLAEEFGAG